MACQPHNCRRLKPGWHSNWLRRGPPVRPWQKKRALKFALKGSGSFKACFELYRCLNPEKSFKSSFKKDFWAFSMISVARCFELQLEFKLSFGVYLVSDVVCCLIDCYYSCCCPSLPSRETVNRVDGFVAPRCVFLHWQIALARSHTL